MHCKFSLKIFFFFNLIFSWSGEWSEISAERKRNKERAVLVESAKDSVGEVEMHILIKIMVAVIPTEAAQCYESL